MEVAAIHAEERAAAARLPWCSVKARSASSRWCAADDSRRLRCRRALGADRGALGCGELGLAQVGGEVAAGDDNGLAPRHHRGLAQDHPRDHVFQFAHVARPRVSQERVDGAPVETDRPRAHAWRGDVAEVATEERDVLAALTQGGTASG